MTSAADPADPPRSEEPWLIKRYANRKLYDTVERRFTSLSRIRTLVRDGVDVLVIDHDTGEDRTAETLSQSIGRRKRGVDTDDLPGLGLLSDLIRAPGKLARAVADQDRDVEEIRGLRREVQELVDTLDQLLAAKSDQDNRGNAPEQG
jgi:polyhydroxyalkanoate synthesis repressor PhaR